MSESRREIDSYKQLRRRLTEINYHFTITDSNGKLHYKTIIFNPKEFDRYSREQIEKYAYLFDKYNPNVLYYDFTKDAFHPSMNPIHHKTKKLASSTDQSESNKL